MDDELKILLGQLLTKVDGNTQAMAVLAAKVDSDTQAMAVLATKVDGNTQAMAVLATKLDDLQKDHAAHREETAKQFVEVKHVAGANYLKLSGQISGVANMLADHIADYHVPGDRKRA